MAKVKPFITSPPNIYNETRASNVVTDVTIVRDKVSLIERFKRLVISFDLNFLKFYRH